MGFHLKKNRIIKMGFYYNQQQPGFYYNQQPGFYYNQQQQGFYYDNSDSKSYAEDWKTNKNAAAVSETAKKTAKAKVAGIMIANNHRPGPTENRVLSQIAAERLAYEAAEIFMNTTSPNDKTSVESIKKAIFKIAIKAIDGDNGNHQ